MPETETDAADARRIPPTAIRQRDGDACVIRLAGDWTDYSQCPDWHDLLPADEPDSPCAVILDADGLGEWNSAAVAFALNLALRCQARGIPCRRENLPEGLDKLLALALAVPELRQEAPAPAAGPIRRLGQTTLALLGQTAAAISFVGVIAESLVRLAAGRTRTRWSDVAAQTARCGHQAIAIVSLMGFLIGVILAFIGSIPLEMFGADIYIATLIGIGILRMMAATTVGTVMAGRTGAAFAAELGSMAANEELDAYTAMGLSPVEILVLPRFLALSLTMPLLCVYADLVGILGGTAVGVLYCGVGLQSFLQHLCATTRLSDFFVGVFTAWVFGLLISACGCYHGLTCGRNSAAVGKAATAAVVSSIVCMVLATALITLVTVLVGI